jgi:RNA polymerase sigma-70 factor, ECF subfamily
MQNNEQELIARSLDGDSAAYGQLVDRYKNALYRHCFAIVRDEDIAEDIAQEAFIAAYYKLRTYNPHYRFSTWLFKIATNKALTWLKKAKREVRADDNTIARIASHHPGPDDHALHSELRGAIEALKPKHRAVISLYYWHGLSYDEIATALASPLGSVKVWMRRAKQQLKKELS